MPTEIFGRENLLRWDFDGITVFVSVFANPAAVHSHAHEDMLSYAVYRGTAEALIDPGRPSYMPADAAFVRATAHNGLVDASWPVRPRVRFFFNRALRAEPRDCGVDRAGDGAVTLWAENQLFGVRRELTIRPQAVSAIRVEERLSSSRILAPEFTHNFPAPGAIKLDPATVRVPSCLVEIAYEGACVEIERAERSRDYGVREPIDRARAILAPARQARIAWTLRPVAA